MNLNIDKLRKLIENVIPKISSELGCQCSHRKDGAVF